VDVELAAYRVAREGLTNTMKYAPGKPTSVLLQYSEEHIGIEVTTDGPVAAPLSHGRPPRPRGWPFEVFAQHGRSHPHLVHGSSAARSAAATVGARSASSPPRMPKPADMTALHSLLSFAPVKIVDRTGRGRWEVAVEDGVRFSVLGPVEAQVGGARVQAGPPQQQAVLAALVLRAGQAVSLHELLGAVRGEEFPGSGASVVRTYVWRLRKLMEPGTSPSRLIESVGDGYRLAVPPEAVDAHRAEQLAAQAAGARTAGEYEECALRLAQALELWKGQPLTGVPGPLAESERMRLSELRLMLLDERFDLELLRGRHARAVPDLTALIRQHPLRERPYTFLMRALYACGRQADALAVFGRAHTVLAEELGVEPGQELCALYERILANDPELATAATWRAAPPTGAAGLPPSPPNTLPTTEAVPPEPPVTRTLPAPSQLPPGIADFTGRAEEMTQLAPALTQSGAAALSVVSISGMGGTGKSVLAVRLAHLAKRHFPDGQLYTDLRGTGTDPADPSEVLRSFLVALGVAGQQIPDGVEDRARLFRTILNDRRVLVVLDGKQVESAALVRLQDGDGHSARRHRQERGVRVEPELSFLRDEFDVAIPRHPDGDVPDQLRLPSRQLPHLLEQPARRSAGGEPHSAGRLGRQRRGVGRPQPRTRHRPFPARHLAYPSFR
jgi:DNA-binding SARP family transcriptional activator